MGQQQEQYEAVVIGAGPGGLATIVSLLDAGLTEVLWVDRAFRGGRLNEMYREISSNTKTHIYLDAIKTSKTCCEIVDSTPSPNAVDELKRRDPEATVQLSIAGDMVMMLLRGVLARNGVHQFKGEAKAARYEESEWTVTLDRDVVAPRLFLCTGSHPIISDLHKRYNPTLKVLDLDRCMIKSTLPDLFDSQTANTVAVIGNSHSGVLVCRNLYEIAREGKREIRVINFRRRAIKFAEYRDDGIVFDNTGLKGDTADWARAHMDDVEQVDLDNEDEVYRHYLPKCTHIVYAIGYHTSPYPELYVDQNRIDREIKFDQHTSGFTHGDAPVPGLHGLGIAHPELVADPEGHVEAAVGLAKFFKFANRVEDQWVRG